MTKTNPADHTMTIATIAFAAFGLGVVITLGLRGSAEAGAAWVSAAATIAAVAAALYAGRWAKEAHRIETDRDERWLLATKTEQARSISVWFETFGRTKADDPQGAGLNAANFLVRNSSTSLIYKVIISGSITVKGTNQELRHYQLGEKSMILVPPGEDKKAALQFPMPIYFTDWPNMESLTEEEKLEHLQVRTVVTFTDSQGVRWTRTSDGELKEQPIRAGLDADASPGVSSTQEPPTQNPGQGVLVIEDHS